MNQPSENVPVDPSAINSAAIDTQHPYLSPLSGLLTRLRKSGHDRKNAKGAFGGKRRSKRHAGLV